MALLMLMPTAGRLLAGMSNGVHGSFMDMPSMLAMTGTMQNPPASGLSMAPTMHVDGVHRDMPGSPVPDHRDQGACSYCLLLIALAIGTLVWRGALPRLQCRCLVPLRHGWSLPVFRIPNGLGACGPPTAF